MKLSKNIIEIIVNYIGFNENIDFECKFLEKNLDNFKWSHISKNKYLPYSFLKKYEDKIHFFMIPYNGKLPFDFIKPHLSEMDSSILSQYIPYENIDDLLQINKINWEYLCKNENIPYTFFYSQDSPDQKKHLDKIDWEEICKNRNISYLFFENILKNKQYANKINWYWLSFNTNIPFTFFEKYKDKIDWLSLSYNEKLPFTFFEKFLNKIHWNTIQIHISFEFIKKYEYNVDWNFSLLCMNKNVPYTFFNKYLDKLDYISWEKLSRNENIPYTFFEKILQNEKYKHNINWSMLCLNKNIPYTFFQKHLDKVDWFLLSLNDNIPYWFFEEHLHKIDWSKIENIPFEIFRHHLDSHMEHLYPNIIDKNKNIRIASLEEYRKILISDIYQQCLSEQLYFNEHQVNIDIRDIENETLNELKNKVDYEVENYRYGYKFLQKIIDNHEIKDVNWDCLLYDNNNKTPLTFIIECINKGKLSWKKLATSIKLVYDDNLNCMKNMLLNMF